MLPLKLHLLRQIMTVEHVLIAHPTVKIDLCKIGRKLT